MQEVDALTHSHRNAEAPAKLDRPLVDCGVAEPSTALARIDAERQSTSLGWPYVAVSPVDGEPLARRLIGTFGVVLGASAGLFVGGLAAALLAALLHPFVPGFARLVLLSLTLFSLAMGAVVGRRVLQRETFE